MGEYDLKNAADIVLKMKTLIEDKKELIDRTEKMKSFYVLRWNYFIQSNYYTNIGEHQKMFEYRTKLIELWKIYPEIKKEYFYDYLYDLNNIISVYFQINQKEKGFELLKQLENEKPQNYFDKVLIFKRVAIKKLLYYMNKGEFEKVLPLIPDIESGLKKYILSKTSELTLISNVATVYYGIEDFHNCLFWTNKIIHGPKTKQRLDIQLSMRVIAMMSLIELDKDYEIIDNFYRSAQRFFSKNGLKDKTQKQYYLLHSLWNFYNALPSERPEILTSFKTEVVKRLSHPTQRLQYGLDECYFLDLQQNRKKTNCFIAQRIRR